MPAADRQSFSLQSGRGFMKNQWKAWLERGQKDLQAAECAFGKRDYMHAAHMTQQGLEKHLKATLVADGVADIKSWGHDFLTKFVKNIKSNVTNGYFDHNTLPQNKANVMVCELESIVQCLKCDDANIAVWKHSLGMKKIGNPDCFKKRKITITKLSSDVAMVKIDILRTKTKSQARSHTQSKKPVRPIKIHEVSTMALLSVADVLIETFPHFEYGRFPNHVDRVSTASIYTEHADGLNDLRIRVDSACTFLAEIAESLDKIHNK